MRKKASITTILVILMIFQAFAQQKSYVGIKGGIGLTDELNNLYETSSIPGYQVNGFYTYEFTNQLSARLEAGFIQKGFAAHVYFAGETNKYETTFKYLSVGPDIILSLPNSEKTVYFLGGIRTDYFLDYTSSKDFQKLHELGYNKLQLLFNAGTGLLWSSGIFLEFNTNIDILNKLKTKNANSSPRFYDLFVGLNVGWRMSL